MKLKLTLGIVATVLAFGTVAAQAHSRHVHRHHVRHVLARAEHHHVRRELARVERHHQVRHVARIEPPASGALRDLVERTAAANGVPYRLANAIVTIESRYNPHVSNGSALGLMQIKPQTARGLGFRGTAASLYDPDVNLRYGMAYLALAYKQSGGSICGTVMRYNSGLGAKRMSPGNRVYCSRASALMAHL